MNAPDRAARSPAAGPLTGATYYGLPAVKTSPFAWHTGGYLFVGGLAGGAQVIAGIADAVGGPRLRPVVRNARYTAFLASIAGAALLIADLKTPRRWYHMLRIFRPTSPMSIGTYVLSAFGASSALAALGEYAGRPALARAAQRPAALAGAVMTTYSGALLAATSNPLWAADAATLAPRLASGALASAAALLSLGERIGSRHANAARLDGLACAATIAHGALTRAAKQRYREAGVGRPLEERPWGTIQKLGNALSIGVPLGCYLLARLTSPARAPALSVAASLGILAGTALKRWNYVNAGNASAKRPEEYLHFTRGPSRSFDARKPRHATTVEPQAHEEIAA